MTKHLGLELALLLLLALLWGSSYLFIKVALAGLPPLSLIALRVSIAAGFLAAVMAWRHERLPRDRRTWRMLFLQAVFNSIGAWTLLSWGQQYIDSGLASVLNSTTPIYVFVMSLALTRHEALDGWKLLGTTVGFAGVSLVVGIDVLQGFGRHVAGELAVLAGALLYACAAIYGKRFASQSALVTATGTMICATLCLVPASLIVERPWTLQPSWPALLAVATLGLGCTGLAMLIYFRLLRTLGSLGVTSQSYLRAGVGVLLGIIVLGEQLTPAIAVGLAAALLGVVAINLPGAALHRAARLATNWRWWRGISAGSCPYGRSGSPRRPGPTRPWWS